ncbi:long-chain-fatty-acid--CoA ligase [Cystobacter fuscus]|uniref:Long-chain-fatty-acid--CoA ligase n=1 Tax=Cystobacter fuscus TaxID=43 RepID=A0A250J889_9BACT|nr:hypothetical protein [Cystobacter fuscus]ATB39768.1 long-chain-fatty-acid--CoA ligase [Cystobacter fuscus]
MPVEHQGGKWDVAEVVMKNNEPHVRLQSAGIQPRHLLMEEYLKGRIVEYQGQPYRLAGTTAPSWGGVPSEHHLLLHPLDPHQLENEPRRVVPQNDLFKLSSSKSPKSPPGRVKVRMDDADQVAYRFSASGEVYTFGAMKHGVFRLNPATPAETVEVPLKDLNQVQVRLKGRELEGLFTLAQGPDGRLQASGTDRTGKQRTLTIRPENVAARYVQVYSPDFEEPVAVDAFVHREAKVRGTALQGTGTTPLRDPLIGSQPQTVRSKLGPGASTLPQLEEFLREPTQKGPVDFFSMGLSSDGEAGKVMEALFDYRSRHPDERIRVIGNESEWSAFPSNKELGQRFKEANIELVFPQTTSKQVINHAKGILIGDRAIFTTASVIPKAMKKLDITTELPSGVAPLYRKYLDLALKPGYLPTQGKQELVGLLSELAEKGVVVNDPVAKHPYVSRTIDGLITGAQDSIRFVGSDLKDTNTARKLIEQAKAGRDVLIQHRGLDPESERLLSEAQQEHLNLQVEDISDWKPYPHFNTVIADGKQAYVGTAFLWSNQLQMVHHGLSYENGVVLEGESVKDLLRQLDETEASVRSSPQASS